MKYITEGIAGELYQRRIEEASDWSGFKVRYTYAGDSLSDYEGTCIVKAKDEKSAIKTAMKKVNKDSANHFRIDGKIDSYMAYKKNYPQSNLEVFEAVDEGEYDGVPTVAIPHEFSSQDWVNKKVKERIKIYLDYFEDAKKSGRKMKRDEISNNFNKLEKICLGITDMDDYSKANQLLNIADTNGFVYRKYIDKLVNDLSTGKKFNLKNTPEVVEGVEEDFDVTSVCEAGKYANIKVPNSDIKKMAGYFAKGSNPRALANTVKNLDKALSRYYISVATGWKECEETFYQRCIELGVLEDDLKEVRDKASKDTSIDIGQGSGNTTKKEEPKKSETPRKEIEAKTSSKGPTGVPFEGADKGKKLKKGDIIHFNDYTMKLGNYDSKTDSFATLKYDKSGEKKLSDSVSTTRREWIENQIGAGKAIMEGLKVVDSGKVTVKKAFTVKEFDEDDGWIETKIKPGTYKYQVIDFRGWKPRQLYVDGEWIDVASDCVELEELLGKSSVNGGVKEERIVIEAFIDEYSGDQIPYYVLDEIIDDNYDAVVTTSEYNWVQQGKLNVSSNEPIDVANINYLIQKAGYTTTLVEFKKPVPKGGSTRYQFRRG